jgi:hypothetical protein
MKIRIVRPSGFDRVRPELARVVDGAAHGEWTLDDLQGMLKRGAAYCAEVDEDDGRVLLVFIWELVDYPERRVVNVLALAGRDLARCCRRFLPTVHEVWKAQGATEITCYTSPAMARLLRRLGFSTRYLFLTRTLK